tara:strand:+ start:383 stop:562 length:180 start_codon:yes stop_codon:yes gene_type:complete
MRALCPHLAHASHEDSVDTTGIANWQTWVDTTGIANLTYPEDAAVAMPDGFPLEKLKLV